MSNTEEQQTAFVFYKCPRIKKATPYQVAVILRIRWHTRGDCKQSENGKKKPSEVTHESPLVNKSNKMTLIYPNVMIWSKIPSNKSCNVIKPPVRRPRALRR